MTKRIITISREFGSGGRTIGKEVAEKLGIPCYDKEFFEKKLNNAGFMAIAPAALVEQQKAGLQKALDKIEMINASIKEIEAQM